MYNIRTTSGTWYLSLGTKAGDACTAWPLRSVAGMGAATFVIDDRAKPVFFVAVNLDDWECFKLTWKGPMCLTV